MKNKQMIFCMNVDVLLFKISYIFQNQKYSARPNPVAFLFSRLARDSPMSLILVQN